MYQKNLVNQKKTIAVWKYTQPQQGGSFKMSTDIINKYTIIQIFSECKLNCAYILQTLFCLQKIDVQPMCRLDIFQSVQEAKKFTFCEKNIIRYIMLCSNYSIVAYPVSYHLDTFKENKPCFENKICFSINKTDNNIHHDDYGEGRGGHKNNYVWALLDWRGSSSISMRVIYDSNNGPFVNRLTRNTFNKWVEEMNSTHNITIDITNV